MHFIRQAHYHKQHWSEMRLLFVSLGLQAFGYSMIKVFLPLFLLKKGIPLPDVALYFAFWSAVQLPMHQVVVWVVNIVGVKHCLATSYAATIVSFLMLGLLPLTAQNILISLAFNGIGQTFYWDARHTQSASVIPKKTRGRNLSLVFIIIMLAAALAPATGGYIGQQFSVRATLVVASVFIVVAIVPLLLSKDDNFRIQKSRKWLPVPKNHLWANITSNFEATAADSFWPIFIYSIIGSLNTVGLLFSAGLVLSVLVALLVGPLTDKGFAGPIVKGAAYGRGITHAMRLAVSTLAGAFLVNTATEVVGTCKATPFAAYFYAGARKYGIQKYIRDMEVAATSSILAAWLSLYLLLQFLDARMAILVLFMVAVSVSPFQSLITRKP